MVSKQDMKMQDLKCRPWNWQPK